MSANDSPVELVQLSILAACVLQFKAFLLLQKPLDSQQQRMANGSYRGRGDPRRGRGRNDGPPGRSYRGGRGGRGPQGMPYGTPPMDAPSNLMAANQRNNDFPRDAARPQRMANDGTAQGQGRGAPFGRGHARGGGANRGRGGRTGNTAQKVTAPKAGGEEASSGKLLVCCYKEGHMLPSGCPSHQTLCMCCMCVCVCVCVCLFVLLTQSCSMIVVCQ